VHPLQLVEPLQPAGANHLRIRLPKLLLLDPLHPLQPFEAELEPVHPLQLEAADELEQPPP